MQADVASPIPLKTRLRGGVLIVLGTSLAAAMVWGLTATDAPLGRVLFGWLLAISVGFVVGGAYFVVRGAMPGPLRWLMAGMLILSAIAMVLYQQGALRLP